MFRYDGLLFNYLDAQYNTTRLNERAIEVPVALYHLREHERDALEVGCVLPHYLPWNEPDYPRHTVLDLYEQWPGIINENVFTWQSPRLYDLVISISTLEHMGGEAAWLRAFERLRSWVAPGGFLFVTVPGQCADPLHDTLWLTPARLSELDVIVKRFDKVYIEMHEWRRIAPPDCLPPLAYDGPTRWANTIYFLEWWRD